MTFCLDDGAPLLNAGRGGIEPPPTAQFPDLRPTGQPSQPFPPAQQQPYYTQPGAGGFKLTNKVIGISGASLLLLGILMPIISVMGIITFSLFIFIQGAMPTGRVALPASMGDEFVYMVTLFRILGIVILLLGAGALLLALKNLLKPLLAIGIAAIALLVFIFIKLQSLLSTVPAEARAFIGVGWGFYAMVAAAVLLIVAGVRREKNPLSGASFGQPG